MYAIVARPAGRSRPDREAPQVTRPRDARWDDYGSTAEPMGPDPSVVAIFSDLQREIMGEAQSLYDVISRVQDVRNRVFSAVQRLEAIENEAGDLPGYYETLDQGHALLDQFARILQG